MSTSATSEPVGPTDARIGTSATSEPVGATEAARIVGVHRANFTRDWASRPDFPSPIGRLARGRLWDRDAVRHYSLAHGPLRGTAIHRVPLAGETKRWAPTIKRRIVRRFRPLRIVVFGSQASGTADRLSDIDLLVIVPDGTDELASTLAIRRALEGLPVSKDILVRTISAVRRYADVPGTMIYEALATGTTIYARP